MMECYEEEKMIDEAMFGIGDQEGRGVMFGGEGLEGHGSAVLGGRGDGRGIVLGGGWRFSEVMEGGRQRRSAFTSTEKTLLVELMDQYKKVIENKRTGNSRF